MWFSSTCAHPTLQFVAQTTPNCPQERCPSPQRWAEGRENALGTWSIQVLPSSLNHRVVWVGRDQKESQSSGKSQPLTEEEGIPGVRLEHVSPVLIPLCLPEVAPTVAGQRLRDVLHMVHLQSRFI